MAVWANEVERRRTCPCGNILRIKVETDADNKITWLECLDNTCYLRRGSLWDSKHQKFDIKKSEFIYCSGCDRRRSLRLFS